MLAHVMQVRPMSHCKTVQRRNSGISSGKAGFTLVEMLVAVGLVLLMMTLFAEVFQLATGSMTKQKGISENDQRARLLVTTLRSDLSKRTFRNVLAFQPPPPAPDSSIRAMNPDADPSIGQTRRGYFYISENDPGSDIDDVLQFTFKTPPQESPLIGRARRLPVLPVDAQGISTTTYSFDLNQPDADDGLVASWTITNSSGTILLPAAMNPDQYLGYLPGASANMTGNNLGSSTTGEVVYFVRNGNLYRRVMLVREPLFDTQTPQPPDTAHVNPTTDPTLSLPATSPAVLPAGPYALQGGGSYVSNFWSDFDYSAYFNNNTPTFASVRDLENSAGRVTMFPIAQPYYRFGFQFSSGRPIEFLTNGSTFIGRFTHEETSSFSLATGTGFLYPGALTGAGLSPYDLAFNGTLIDDTDATGVPNNPNGVVDDYEVPNGVAGTRTAEDLLMQNVHAFDIKVFDDHPSVYRFVDLGTEAGFYSQTFTGRTTASHGGPVTIVPQVPSAVAYSAIGVWGNQNTGYGPRVNPTYPPFTAGNRCFDTWDHNLGQLANVVGSDQPPFRPVDFGPDQLPGTANVDDDGNDIIDVHRQFYPIGHPSDDTTGMVPDPLNGQYDEGEIGYPNTDDNVHPLRSVQIHIRYLDITSNLVRDLTIVHSLVDH